MHLEGSMTCPQNTIWDGVTLAFNRKHLLPTLEPPTTPIYRTKYNSRLVRRVITGKPLTMDGMKAGVPTATEEEDEDCDEEGDDENGDDALSSQRGTRSKRAAEKVQLNMLERLEAIPRAVEGLRRACPSLGALFDAKFGEESVMRNEVAPDVYRRFFIQVCAEESVLQMATKPTLDALDAFVAAPNARTSSALVEIPAVHELLSFERAHKESFLDSMVEICQWISQRGRMVLESLIKNPELLRIVDFTEKPWTETGCCYGLPKIRERPWYPKLKHDLNNDVGGKRGAKCSKFYSQYGERQLTGGIMCVWCTHSICYGFHCIPKGEGRNDVFSALITRWEKAPKRVIHGALGPYCMTREPAFFAETQFLIDDFHSVGHTKCAPAAFLKTHCNVDPRLSYINSSAGECGNSGLGRIRKSVSYMSQKRAILYSRVFLCIWNRLRIQKLNQ
ncbi:hypothetical protein R3P38DRAFT_3316395 [Favolaschia claudopus]|uniref:Uncharacterized protein n=1 Tax=Favolaschia claudopus TaxID=2862362 RepID=A0AAW0BH45_9AGAR